MESEPEEEDDKDDSEAETEGGEQTDCEGPEEKPDEKSEDKKTEELPAAAAAKLKPVEDIKAVEPLPSGQSNWDQTWFLAFETFL